MGLINTLFAKFDLLFKDETVDEVYSTYSTFTSFNKSEHLLYNDGI